MSEHHLSFKSLEPGVVQALVAGCSWISVSQLQIVFLSSTQFTVSCPMEGWESYQYTLHDIIWDLLWAFCMMVWTLLLFIDYNSTYVMYFQINMMTKTGAKSVCLITPNFITIRSTMGGGTGLADPATAGPMFAIWCLKSQQMRSQRSCSLLGRFLIAGLKQIMKFLCKANGTTLH